MGENRVLEGHVEYFSRLMEGKGLRRKVMDDDLKWLL